MKPDRIVSVSYRQDGLITREQAIAAGLTEGAVRYATGCGDWQVIFPGIYSTFNGPLTELHRLRAAILYGGSGAVVTGVMACRLYRLCYVPDVAGVDVLIAHHRQRRDVGFVYLHRTKRLPKPVYWSGDDDGQPQDDWDLLLATERGSRDPIAPSAVRRHIPLAPPARAAIDAVRFRYLDIRGRYGGSIPGRRKDELLRETRALLCEAVQRRRVRIFDVVDELDAASSSGTSIARLAMQDILAGCRSAPECELRDLIMTSKILPEPRWNRPLPGYRPERRADRLTPDACLEEARLVVEVDSVEWHRIGPRQEQTEKRRARYAELGWLVISVSPYRIRSEPSAVLRDIERAYLAQVRGSSG